MRKLIKIARFLHAALQPKSALPFFWHIGRPNFGDDINPVFFRMCSHKNVRFSRNRNEPHYLGIGSILESARDASIVLGSGFIAPPTQPLTCRKLIAVRGALTAAYLRSRDRPLLGDPLVLIDHVVKVDNSRRSAIGFVPHVTSIKQARALDIPWLKVIDPAESPLTVIRKIASCERLFSQSLHGLIVADALRVPNMWIAPGPGMKGGVFKFEDYFSTLDRAKEPWPWARETFLEAAPKDFHVGFYKYDKRCYLEALTEVLATEKL